MTTSNDVQTCFDKLSMTAFNNLQPLKVKEQCQPELVKGGCVDRLSITALNDVQACFDKLSMTVSNDFQTSLRTCFDKLSLTAFNNLQPLKAKEQCQPELVEGGCFDKLSMTGSLHTTCVEFRA